VRGEVFGLATVTHLRGFAAAVLCSAVLGLVVPAVLSVVLTWQAPPGGTRSWWASARVTC